MSEPRLLPETRELVWFSGADSVGFLNDLISQEIASVSPGTVVRSLLLEPRGKLSHLLWVLRGEDRVGLITDSGRGPDLVATLGRYRIRVDVQIGEPETGWLVLEDGTVPPGEWLEDGGRLMAGLRWNGPPLTFVTGMRPEVPEISRDEMERVRILAREPRFGVDVDGSTIPQESGLVPDTVSFTKGCYLGQELVARIDSRGHVNRSLRLIEFSETPEPGTDIDSAGRIVGTLTSVSGDLGLGMVRRELGPGSQVRVGEVAGVVRD